MTEPIDYSAETTTAKRPTFLTVLCIITFIVSGWTLIQGVRALFSENTFDQASFEQSMEQAAQAMGGADAKSQEMVESMMSAANESMQAGMENATTLAIVGILASVLSILGAYLMFTLKKSGYYTYIGAKVIGVIVPLAIMGVNLVTGFMYGFIALIGIIFIILYGVNRKHLH